MKKFKIPEYYQSPIIGKVKEIRRVNDPRKKDFSPTLLNFGAVQFHIARHFGFCFGVEMGGSSFTANRGGGCRDRESGIEAGNRTRATI